MKPSPGMDRVPAPRLLAVGAGGSREGVTSPPPFGRANRLARLRVAKVGDRRGHGWMVTGVRRCAAKDGGCCAVCALCRHGGTRGTRQAVTALLLTTLSGIQRALSYVLLHGITALTLAALWRRKQGWSVTLPVASLVRQALLSPRLI